MDKNGMPMTHEVWIYKKTGNKYHVLLCGEMKIGQGEWIKSVTYKSLGNGEIYTRDIETFMQKFEWAQ